MNNQPNHILLVEDNPEDYDVFMYALEQVRISVEVTRFACGRQALEYLQSDAGGHNGVQQSKPIDLVILDINLPRVSGLQLLRELRKMPGWLGIPALILTTSPDPRDIKDAYRNGANSFLVKPVALDNYISLLEAMCRYWLYFSQSFTGRGGTRK